MGLMGLFNSDLGGKMEYVKLGKTGLRVSRICLGCMTYGEPARPGEAKGGRHPWALNEEESQPFFRQALDLGINFFDTANVYSSGVSEEALGGFSMYCFEFPKALYLRDLHSWTRFVSMQNHYNLLYREEEREMLGLCKAEGIGVLPWSPLARGRLTRPWQSAPTERLETDQFGKSMYARTEEADRRVVDSVVQVAQQRGVPPAQVALAWMLSKPAITAPIVGATKLHHLADAVAALSLQLSTEEVASLEEPYT